eukprot:144485_1
MGISDSYEGLLSAICLYSVAAVIIALLFTAECISGIRFKMRRKKHGTSPRHQKKRRITSTQSMWFLSEFSIFGFGITCLFGVATRVIALGKWSSSSCEITAILGSCMYIVSKTLMYCLFIYRLYHVYHDSHFSYSFRFLSTLASISVLLSLICITLMNFFGKNEYIYIQNGDTSIKNCTMSFPLWLTGYAAFNDLLNQGVLLYLFIKPLILLQKEMNKKHKSRKEFRQLCLKYYILGLMASISTVLFLLTVPVLKTVIFATVDCVINSFCLLFCFHHWDKYYICICKGFIYLVEALCFKKSKMEEITLNLGVTSSQAKLDRLET